MEKRKALKIGIAVLLLVLMSSGGLFAESYDGPKHTVTADLGPLIFGLGVGAGLNSALGSGGGWGFGLQYEFQPFRYFSFAGKFSMMGVDTKISQSGVNAALDFSSFSIDGHARWYPWGKTFFLDGMLGYANFKTKLDASGTFSAMGKNETINLKDTMDLNFFRLGAELGWRITFGKPGKYGNFVFEPSIGYAIGIGDTSHFKNPDELSKLKEQMEKLKDLKPLMEQYLGYSIPDIDTDPAGLLNGLNDLLGTFLFVGGPKVSLSLGWRF